MIIREFCFLLLFFHFFSPSSFSSSIEVCFLKHVRFHLHKVITTPIFPVCPAFGIIHPNLFLVYLIRSATNSKDYKIIILFGVYHINSTRNSILTHHTRSTSNTFYKIIIPFFFWLILQNNSILFFFNDYTTFLA